MLAEALITSNFDGVVPFNAEIRGQLAQGIGPLFDPYLKKIEAGLGCLNRIKPIAYRVLPMRACFECVNGVVEKAESGQLYGAREFGTGWEFHWAESPLEGCRDVPESEANAALTGALLHVVGNSLAVISGSAQHLERHGPPEAVSAATAIFRASGGIGEVLKLFQERSVLEVVGPDNDVVRPNRDDEIVFPSGYSMVQAAA